MPIEFPRSFRELLPVVALALVAGAVLWPPSAGLNYWTTVGSAVGGTAVLVLVFGLSAAVGGAVAVLGIDPWPAVGGGTVAYLVGIALVELRAPPGGYDSPVHYALYGVLLVAGVVGYTTVRWSTSRS